MKISIVTVYNSLNSGSFLQAFTLMKALEMSDNEVVFLKTKARNPLRDVFLSSLRSLSNGDYKKIGYLLKKYTKFRSIVSKLPKIGMVRNEMIKQDIYVLGSDEIWNVKRPDFNKFPVFWGYNIDSNSIIAYAPSINRSTILDILQYEFTQLAINNMNSIGVRDKHTKITLEELTNKEISLVLDPTMLFDTDFYRKYEAPIKDKNYILVYSYSNHFNEKQIKRIKEYSKRKELPLISVNHMMSWCDKSVPVSPFEFLTYYRDASYVITDTFHGTIFSIIYQKKFLCYGDDNIKVLDLLDRMNLNLQNYDGLSDVSIILDKEINYDAIMKTLDEQKKESWNYLNKAMMKDEN
ncbi:MAG: hypothetical protein CVV00_05140 [Firmicutes bacterium HGW-Firmicutes-5]|nr:MAG: hypothetical protein CVV00_05140 [Firmicutes bacterium HGW-Firmicutes-5]